MTASPDRHWTPAEYLAFERAQPQRHALVDGQVVLQAGGSRAHALIAANALSALHQQLRESPCSVFGSDMRIAIPQRAQYVYPDLSIACEPTRFEDHHEDTLLEPRVIIEVLSRSTEHYDRGKKFQAYQAIESFQEYVLIAQDAVLIEHFVRHTDKLWTFEVITDLSADLDLHSVACRLRVSDLYAKVALPPAPSEG